jgi:hypothetical protein
VFAVERAARYAGGSQSTRDASLALRLRVRLGRGGLDRQLADAPVCDLTRALALRSRQLTDRRTRQELARSLREIVDRVEAPPRLMSADVIDRAAVRVGREPLLGLAERLEASGPVNPRGVALAKMLLTDGLSPLYNRFCERSVTEAVWEIQDDLNAFYAEHAPVLGDAPRPAPDTHRDAPTGERNSCERW